MITPSQRNGTMICEYEHVLPVGNAFPLAAHALYISPPLLFNRCAVFSFLTDRQGRPSLGHQCEPPIVCLCLLCEGEPIANGLPALLQVELLELLARPREPLAHGGLTQSQHSRDL